MQSKNDGTASIPRSFADTHPSSLSSHDVEMKIRPAPLSSSETPSKVGYYPATEPLALDLYQDEVWLLINPFLGASGRDIGAIGGTWPTARRRLADRCRLVLLRLGPTVPGNMYDRLFHPRRARCLHQTPAAHGSCQVSRDAGGCPLLSPTRFMSATACPMHE